MALCITALLWLILGLAFRYYYDLNDDVMIKDIISGIYTGTPEAHNNQMMYPISLIFAALYRILPVVPWFGLCEIACFGLCFYIIAVKLLEKIEKPWMKWLYLALQSLVWFGCYLWELTMLQYTVVCGMLCAAASVWVYMTDISFEENARLSQIITKALKAYAPAIILATLAFNIRSEMFLLMCPWMAAAGVCKWVQESTIFTKANVTKYFSLIGCITLLVGLTTLVDGIAYSSPDWKAYREFFDARTDVYDFTGIPDYEANKDFYMESGITKAQYTLISNYNFLLDEDIDSSMLNKIATYVKSGQALKPDGTPMNSTSRSVKTAIGEYVRGALDWKVANGEAKTLFAEERAQLSPMNILVLILYIALVFIAYMSRDWQYLVKLPTLVALRSLAWIYVYYKGRLVPRITHPMYMIELVILTALIVHELTQENKARFVHGVAYLAFVFVGMISILNIAPSVKDVRAKQAMREAVNAQVAEINEYTAHRSDYYYIDVYSTVSYTEPVFGWPRLKKTNQQLAGGWATHSPLDAEKVYVSTPMYDIDYAAAKELARIKLNWISEESPEELGWMTDAFMSQNPESELSYEVVDVIEGNEYIGPVYVVCVRDEKNIEGWE